MSPLIRILAAFAVAAALSGPALADSKNDPLIVEARANGAQTALEIRGYNLAGTKPVLTLGTLATPLQILSATSTRMEALLPAGIEPGSYLLALTVKKKEKNGRDDDDGDERGDIFWVTIGAAGPAGKDGIAGPAGQAGASGPMGPQGLPGPTGATGPQGPAGQQGAVGPMGPPGAPGTGGTLVSFDALAGMPCNVANTGNACRGTTALEFDPATKRMEFACIPTSPRSVLRVFIQPSVWSPEHHIGISVLPSTLGVGPYDIEYNAGYFKFLVDVCEGTVVTVNLVRYSVTPNPPAVPVLVANGGSCVSASLPADASVSCTLTVSGNAFTELTVY